MSGLTSIKIYSINYITNSVHYQGGMVNFTNKKLHRFYGGIRYILGEMKYGETEVVWKITTVGSV